MVAATLGLLAFILAFTFGLAASRFDSRMQVLLDEANAIGTTYLRAGMLPEQGKQIRALLREYADARLGRRSVRQCCRGNKPVGEYSKPGMGGSGDHRNEKPQFDCGRSIRSFAE